MKMSRTAIKELTAAYRAVLKHAFIAAMGAMVVIGGASAENTVERKFITETDFVSGENISNQNFLTAEDPGSDNAGYGGYAFIDRNNTVLNIKDSSYTNNTFDGSGAVFATRIPKVNTTSTLMVKNTHFIGNSATESGGAISNFNILNVTGSEFKDNNATVGVDAKGLIEGGGAIFLGSESETKIDTTIFAGNSSKTNGGAIGMRLGANGNNSAAKLNISATFDGNHADANGGAIYNTFYANNGLELGDGVTVAGNFTKNSAGKNGGAIFNDGAKDNIGNAGGVMTIRDSVFSENTATTWGGAIFNSGTLTLGDGVSFTGNSAYAGGAVWNDGKMEIAAGTKFVGNNSKHSAGALYNSSTGTLGDLIGVIFENNTAVFGGAINNSKTSTGIKGGTIDLISESHFIGNSAGSNQGGAIRNQGTISKIEKSVFDSNVAGNGGAINNGTLGSVVEGIYKTKFINNTAIAAGGNHQGGAITNAGHIGIIDETVFESNRAGKIGGAIANVTPQNNGSGLAKVNIANSTFTGNVAGESGGAIYNATGGAVSLAGENTFTGNMAGGVGNDIHNLGKLTVSDGTTTIDGGIAGDGALTIADGATLNIGTTTVQQKELTLDGTVGATIVGANNYGKLLAETYKGNGKVSLNVATTGTYNIFGENANEYTVVDAGAIYDVTKGDNGAVTIATKKVEEIAAGAGLTNTAANTVAALANVDNDLANIASLNVQQALRNGDTDYIETESAKANPVDKPVVQSVAQSVQGAVMTLAANRMAGAPSAGTMGRSGGDLSDADYGVWAQGMFNKSKFNGQFNGYTRGVSAGFDALIDKQYTIGLGYAFGHSDVHANGGRDTEIDSNSIFAYAQYKPSEWFVNAALNYTMSKYTETVDAFGVRLKSDYDTDAFGGQVMTGYDFASGLTPEVGLRYLHVTQDSYNNGLNNVSSDDTDFLTGIAGMKYRFAIENDSVINWFPELRAAATYDFVSDKAMSTVTMPGAASYVVDGDRLSRFGGEFGIGLTAEYNGLEISLVYDLNLHKDYTSQTGMAKFRYEF